MSRNRILRDRNLVRNSALPTPPPARIVYDGHPASLPFVMGIIALVSLVGLVVLW